MVNLNSKQTMPSSSGQGELGSRANYKTPSSFICAQIAPLAYSHQILASERIPSTRPIHTNWPSHEQQFLVALIYHEIYSSHYANKTFALSNQSRSAQISAMLVTTVKKSDLYLSSCVQFCNWQVLLKYSLFLVYIIRSLPTIEPPSGAQKSKLTCSHNQIGL